MSNPATPTPATPLDEKAVPLGFGEAAREMTLGEYMARLPVFHRAHREYVELLQDRAALPVPPVASNCDGCAQGLPIKDGQHYRDGLPWIGCTASRYAAPVARSGEVEAAIDKALDEAWRDGNAECKRSPEADKARTELLALCCVIPPPSDALRIIARTHEILAAQGRVADMILRKTGRMAVGLDDWATIDSLCVAVAVACGCVLESEGNMMRTPE